MPDHEPTTPDIDSEGSTPSEEVDASDLSPSRPTISTTTLPNMSSSSSPLGNVNAARRPAGVAPSQTSLPMTLQERMRNMMLSRQGSAQAPRPGMPTPNASATGSTPSLAGGIPVIPKVPGMGSPVANSSRITPASPKGPAGGGLAGKRGIKGGLKLSDAVKPAENGEAETPTDTGSQFNKFQNIVDAKSGTLTFKDKAVVHGSGIDFSNGTTFKISLDEVDTLEELGKGNYGTVFKVRHARPSMRKAGQGLRGNMKRHFSTPATTLDQTKANNEYSGLIMAMKEIRLELEDAKFAQIVMELDILHRCISPFIIDFYGAFFQEGSVYICLEHMDGGSIDKLYGDGVPEGVLRKITLSTIMGLKYLKDEHNIIHRDVKPTNILVNSKGQVKICDFGVSGNLVASVARTNIGCQSYMAPERISGGGMSSAGASSTGSYSVQSDIWSLGLTVIECAMGRYPYPPETYNNIFSQLSVSSSWSVTENTNQS